MNGPTHKQEHTHYYVCLLLEDTPECAHLIACAHPRLWEGPSGGHSFLLEHTHPRACLSLLKTHLIKACSRIQPYTSKSHSLDGRW